MYQAYFGLKELPFRISPDPRFIYLTSQHQEVLAKCQYSVAEKMGIAAIFGTIGAGKTSLARRLWEQYATQPEYTFALLIHPNYPTPFQFLKAILREYGLIKPKRSLEDMVAYFEEFLIEQHRNGKTPILVIDEAQTLRPPSLGLLRQLLNFETNTEKLLQIILFGDNDLLLRLDNSAALKDRVTIFGALTSLSRKDSDDLIAFRYRVAGGGDTLPFGQDALAAIFKYSQGLPRRICRICDNALIRAFTHNLQTVDEAMIRSIAEEIRLNEPTPVATLISPVLEMPQSQKEKKQRTPGKKPANQQILKSSNASQQSTFEQNGTSLPTTHSDAQKRPVKPRHGFDIYWDQYEALVKWSNEEKLQGGTGSMSRMVREALDDYIAKRKKK